MLLHVLKMLAIESQKLISNTSDGLQMPRLLPLETTAPSLLITISPSIHVFFAGDLQQILHKLVDLDNLGISNNNVSKLSTLPTKPILTVLIRSLLAHHYNLFFKTYKGDYAELFTERVIDHNCKQSCTLPVTRAIAKHDASGKSITMDIKTFAHVSHVHSFGKHMPVDLPGVQFSAVYDCHELAEHAVLAGFQFDPGGCLS